MRHILLIAGLVSIFVSGTSATTPFWQDIFPTIWNPDSTSPPLAPRSSTMMAPACVVEDSLELIKFYNSLNINTLTNSTCQWILTQPVADWPGVTIDNEGYVTVIQMINNAPGSGCQLTGTLPTNIGSDNGLTRLHTLKLSINAIGGTIPPSIGNLPNLETLWLDDNLFTGTIPPEMANCTKMSVLWLDNNDFSGAIPEEFKNLDFFRELVVFNNNFDSLPNFTVSSITNFTQDNDIQVRNNAFTFDDLLPNLNFLIGATYTPQDSFFSASTVTWPTGTTQIIDLGIDADITTNQYRWFRNSVPYGPILNTNKLEFDPVSFATAGTYCCQVTNPALPLLTLYSRCVTVNVECGQSVEMVNDTLCAGESIVVGGATFGDPALGFPREGTLDVTNPDQFGCDSIIVVDLTIVSNTPTSFTPTICQGDTLFVNGNPYYLGNDVGTEDFDLNGCDSTVNVDLNFYAIAERNIDDQICRSDTVFVNGNPYYLGNASGVETVPNATANGCDSIYNIVLNFHPEYTGELDLTICSGETIDYNGTTYSETNTSGTEIRFNAAPNGCDSIVTVQVTVSTGQEYDENSTLCAGDSIAINGVFYGDISAGQLLTGTEMITLANGCDSIINIDLSIEQGPVENFAPFWCVGTTMVVGGETIGPDNQSGTILIPDVNGGCDTIFNYFVNFYPTYTDTVTLVVCEGGSTVFNGVTYNSGDTGGPQTVAGVAPNGCDSIYNVGIVAHTPPDQTISPVICEGETFELNGQVFDENRLVGTVILSDSSFYGCDSTVHVNLTITPAPTSNTTLNLCPGTSQTYNGTLYGSQNGGIDNGTETIMAATGCDTIETVNVQYYVLTPGVVQAQICRTDTFTYNGQDYFLGNETGQENIGPLSYTGCDSTVNVQVTFFPLDTMDYNQTLCSGTTVEINGTVYGESPNFPESGIEVFENGKQNGCDSIVAVQLAFNSFVENNVNETICGCETREFNGMVYDCNNATDTITLSGASEVGCDSIININLNYITPPETFLSLTLCPGEDTVVNGVLYNELKLVGTETFGQITADGCDSTVFINLTYLDAIVGDTLSNTICTGDSLIWNGVAYDQPGIYTQQLDNAAFNGCDSTAVIALAFAENIMGDTTDYTICTGDSLMWNGMVYNQAGIFSQLLDNAAFSGCDSTAIIQLAFAENIMGDTTDYTICTGDSLVWNGMVYNQAGIFSQLLDDAAFSGCDSTAIIQLAFAETILGDTVQAVICDGEAYDFNGTTYAIEGVYDALLDDAAQSGCDSIAILNLTVTTPGPVELEPLEQICPSADPLALNTVQSGIEGEWSGTNVMANAFAPAGLVAGDYELTFTPTTGCATLNTTSITVADYTTGTLSDSLCIGEILTIGSLTIDMPGTYRDTVLGTNGNCDSITLITITPKTGSPTPLESLAGLCTNDSPVELNPVQNGIEGIWSGDNVVDNVFDPTDLVGPIQLTFTPDIIGCFTTNTTEIMVNDGGPVMLDTFDNICEASIPIDLDTMQSGVVGTWAGEGVDDNTFDPDGLDGTVSLTFTPDVVSCVTENTTTIAVEAATPIQLEPLGKTCQNTTVALPTIINGVSGTWTGNGVTNNEFTATTAMSGNMTLTFTPDAAADCLTADSTMIFVNTPAISTINQSICDNPSITINDVTYDTPGMFTDTIFSGTFNGCDSILNITIVADSIDIVPDVLNDICESGMPLSLPTTQSGITGTWSGLGVENNIFTPTGLGGSIDLTFTANAGQCADSATTSIVIAESITNILDETICSGDVYTINNVDYVTEGQHTETIAGGAFSGCDSVIVLNLTVTDGNYTVDNFAPLCASAAPIDLPTTQGGITGNWLGDGVSNNTFDPSELNGSVELSFVPNNNDCAETGVTTISVQPIVTENIDTTICSNDVYTINNVDYATEGQHTETIVGGSFSGCDSVIVLNLSVELVDTLPLADAGMDQLICGEEAALSANAPTGATGTWSFAGAAATLSDPTDNTAMLFDLTAAQYQLVWSLSTDVCINYTQDTVIIDIAQTPVAVADSIEVLPENLVVDINITDNDIFTNPVNVELLNEPNIGELSDHGGGHVFYTVPAGFLAAQTGFAYTLCDETCPALCTETEVIFNLLGDDELRIPSGITPNDDGLNDTFVIPAIRDRPDIYNRTELVVFNRWGDVVFEAFPYQNDWDGSGPNGKTLPEGTYYYVLHLNLGNGEVHKGDITILR